MSSSAWHFIGRGILILLVAMVAAKARAETVQVADLSFAYTGVQTHTGNTLNVTLSAAPSSPTVVRFDHDDGGYVYFPWQVIFPAGQTQMAVPVYAFGSFTGQLSVTAWAWVPGTPWRSAHFDLFGGFFFGYYVPQPDLYGGDSFESIVEILPEGAGWFKFSDSSPLVSSPAPWSVVDNGHFPHWTKPVSTPTSVWLWATYLGVTKEAGITLHPRPTLATLAVDPPTIKGGLSAAGTLSMTFPGFGGPIPISVSDSSILVSVPASVEVPNGQQTANFAIDTVPVNKTYIVTVRARDRSVVRTAVLQIVP